MVCVSFSPNGQLIGAGTIHGNVVLIDAQTGRSSALVKQPDGIESLCFLSAGDWLAMADRGGGIQIQRVPLSWEHSAEQPEMNDAPPIRWLAHTGRATSLAVIPEIHGLVSGGRDAVMRVWMPDFEATQWKTFRAAEVSSIAVDKHNRLYLAADKIFVWDMRRRRLLQSFAASEVFWQNVACSANGQFLVAVREGEVVLFDLPSLGVVQKWNLTIRPITFFAPELPFRLTDDGSPWLTAAMWNMSLCTIGTVPTGDANCLPSNLIVWLFHQTAAGWRPVTWTISACLISVPVLQHAFFKAIPALSPELISVQTVNGLPPSATIAC